MNRFLPERFDEFVTHLTLGIEPIDALRRSRVESAMDITFDLPAGTPLAMPANRRRRLGLREDADVLTRLDRHPSMLYVLLYDKRVRAPFQLRFREPARRFVPRRIAFNDALPPPSDLSGLVFIGRPRFFPGAGYPVHGAATGVRGRAIWHLPDADGRGDIPAPWVRVEARVNNRSVGWAHGDDRGEFLLLLPPDAAHETPELDESLEIAGTITVFAPGAPPPKPPVPRPGDPQPDPLQHLTIEHVGIGDEDVPIDQLPWTGGKQVGHAVNFRLGRVLSLREPFVFNP